MRGYEGQACESHFIAGERTARVMLGRGVHIKSEQSYSIVMDA
jgi:hypothetical protein